MELALSQKYLRRIYALLTLGLLFLVIAIGCLISSVLLTDTLYQRYISISAATEQDQRLVSYQNAIRLAPERPEGYLLLLGIYAEDGVFEKTESQQFLAIYNACQQELMGAPQAYSQVAARAGYLYVNGYDDSATVKLRMAYPFFQAALEHMDPGDSGYTALRCYCSIGSYYADYIWDASAVREVSAQQMQELLRQIQGTLNTFDQENGTDSVYNRLGFSLAVCNLLYDQRSICAVTVEAETVMAVYDQIYAALPDSGTLQKDQSKALLELLLANRENYYDMVMRAYRREGSA